VQCLLFNLKRYEFNLVTLTRDKVNDYYAFPDVVDMWPYTEEGLAAAAERPHSHAHAQSSCSQSRDAGQRQQYLYRLRGVVVQSGTEKSGHYYSYIQVRLPAPGYLGTRATYTRFSSGWTHAQGLSKYRATQRGVVNAIFPRTARRACGTNSTTRR
jgi:hypothetical protein